MMEEAIHRPLEIEAIARQLAMSRRHLDRLFETAFDCSTFDYYRMIRLSRARKLVKGTQMELTTIAGRCGFNSYPRFLQRYREAFAISPADDRASTLLQPTQPDKVSPLTDLHPYQSQLDPKRLV